MKEKNHTFTRQHVTQISLLSLINLKTPVLTPLGQHVVKYNYFGKFCGPISCTIILNYTTSLCVLDYGFRRLLVPKAKRV